MFKELMTKAVAVKQEGFIAHYREAFNNATGAVNIGVIAAEAID